MNYIALFLLWPVIYWIKLNYCLQIKELSHLSKLFFGRGSYLYWVHLPLISRLPYSLKTHVKNPLSIKISTQIHLMCDLFWGAFLLQDLAKFINIFNQLLLKNNWWNWVCWYKRLWFTHLWLEIIMSSSSRRQRKQWQSIGNKIVSHGYGLEEIFRSSWWGSRRNSFNIRQRCVVCWLVIFCIVL